MYHIFFIYSSVDGYLAWFHNSATVIIVATHGCAGNPIVDWCRLRFLCVYAQGGIAGSYGSPSFLLRNLHTDFL
jgi:hypothetical protein